MLPTQALHVSRQDNSEDNSEVWDLTARFQSLRQELAAIDGEDMMKSKHTPYKPENKCRSGVKQHLSRPFAHCTYCRTNHVFVKHRRREHRKHNMCSELVEEDWEREYVADCTWKEQRSCHYCQDFLPTGLSNATKTCLYCPICPSFVIA